MCGFRSWTRGMDTECWRRGRQGPGHAGSPCLAGCCLVHWTLVTWGNLQGCVLWLALCPGTFEMQKMLASRGLIDEWQALALVWAW